MHCAFFIRETWRYEGNLAIRKKAVADRTSRTGRRHGAEIAFKGRPGDQGAVPEGEEFVGEGHDRERVTGAVDLDPAPGTPNAQARPARPLREPTDFVRLIGGSAR
jgi:hypothetical protein